MNDKMMSEDYLKTARVLVVDDQPEEAIPIMRSLGRLGIGCIYQRGIKVEDLPEEPFEGIRLVFLDLQLDQEGEAKIVLSKTVSVLKALINTQTMPLLVICWTKHEDYFEKFVSMAVKHIRGLKPGFIEKMKKPANDSEDWGYLFPGIKEIIKKFPALQITWDWEQVVHDAVSQTTQMLANIVSSDFENDMGYIRDKWIEGLIKLFRTLVLAESGQIVDKSNAQQALFNVMNALLKDRINHTIFDKKIAYAEVIIPQRNESISETQKARLNQMLLVERVRNEDTSINPGNIYLPDEKLEKNCIHMICNLEFKKLAGEIIEVKNKDPLYSEYKNKEEELKRTINKNSDNKELPGELSSIRRKIKRLPYTIRKRCKPILVEISPACDFLQKKRPVSRFIGGILIPEKHKFCLKSGEYLNRLDPLTLPGIDEIWVPVLNSRYQYGVTYPEKFIKNKPLCRFRSHVLVDIQVWAASRAIRPGKLSIG